MTLLPTVLCRGWRSSMGCRIACHHPTMQQGDEGGRIEAGWQCSLCGAFERQANETRWQRECRRTAARAAKGYGPGTGDPFAGF